MNLDKLITTFQNFSAIQGILLFGLLDCSKWAFKSFKNSGGDTALAGGLLAILVILNVLMYLHLKKMKEGILRDFTDRS